MFIRLAIGVNVINKFKNSVASIVWAVVVAQLVERLLPTPEVRSSNPVIGKKIYIECFLSKVLKRRK